MRDAVALQRVEAFEEQKRLRIGVAGRIALEHGREVRPHGGADLGIGLHRLFEHLAGEHRRDAFAADLGGKQIGQRVFQPVMLQDRPMCQTGNGRLARGKLLRLLAQGRPDGIDLRDFSDVQRHEELLLTAL